MRVRLTHRARADLRAAAAWWKRNREKAPGLLRTELEEASRLLAALPRSGEAVEDPVLADLRKLDLLRTRYVLFYLVDEALQEVTVLRLWHMSRGKKLRLR